MSSGVTVITMFSRLPRVNYDFYSDYTLGSPNTVNDLIFHETVLASMRGRIRGTGLVLSDRASQAT
jgi:hypothetical protein